MKLMLPLLVMRFVGEEPEQISCPSNGAGSDIPSVTWYMASLDGSGEVRLNLSAGSGLSRGATIRHLKLNITPQLEGLYSCTDETSHRRSACLLVIGKS